uniref:adenylyl-sulfate kinase n=1 Tax=Meloidogyne incognita TaxID=6306 RepID=A0A914NN58_MELIC
DGDNVRHGLCRNLGFSKTDRAENIRRVGEVAKLFGDSGMVVLASFISPFKVDRDFARRIHEQDNIPFFEIYINTSLEICEARDPKTRAGEIKEFTGVDSAYEPPLEPDLILNSGEETEIESIQKDNIPFFEIYINTSLEICEARDPKKLYKKARAGEIKEFTGVDSAYEPPLEPDLILNSGEETEIESIQKVFNFLYEKKILPEEAMYQLCGQPIRQLFEFNKEEQNKLIEEIGNNLNFKIEISEIDLQWIQVLAEGWASPLAGFMRERQYLQCLHFGQIFDLKKKCQINGERKEGDLNCDEEENDGEDQFPMLGPINQTIPIVLPIFDNQANLIKSKLSSKPKIQLIFKNKLIGILKDIEIFPHRKKERIHRQFGHFVEEKEIENGHPGIKLIMESGDWLVGGDLKVFERIIYNDGLDEYRKTPSELKQIFRRKTM